MERTKENVGLKKKSGITLIALVVTIVILIILATISVNLIINGGLINKTESGVELHKREAARERLSMTLGAANLEKRMSSKYNQDEFLDKLIVKEVSGAKILGDIVVVDGYGFEIDRSVPKIGKYVGKESELVFPELRLEKQIEEDSKLAIIRIIAKEEKDGISKIEILQDGFVIETYEYSNIKEEITQNYEVRRNGEYVVKVYSALPRTEMIEISELVANIKYSPNGSEEYKKEHTVQISVDKTVDRVTSIEYQWTNTTEEPEEGSFTESCTDGAKITKNEVTGQWYLWTLIETEGGKKRIEKSEAFKFDNKGPEVELTSTPTSETSFTLTATATDEYSGIAKYEFYVEGKLVKTIETNEGAASFEVTDKEMGKYDSYVTVMDKVGNQVKKTLEVRTKMHTWEHSVAKTKSSYHIERFGQVAWRAYANSTTYSYTVVSPNLATGEFTRLEDRFIRGDSLVGVRTWCGPKESYVYEIDYDTSLSGYTYYRTYREDIKETKTIVGWEVKDIIYTCSQDSYDSGVPVNYDLYEYKGIE